MTQAYMVTATGTEIGKTYSACSLLEEARRQGKSVQAVKPVMSGFDPGNLAHSDAGRLALSCGLTTQESHIKDICYAQFVPPLAPNVAARQAGQPLSYAALHAFTEVRLKRGADFTLVEGAGGLFSPLSDTHLNADLAKDLGLPLILVTANYLGSITHTLATLLAAKAYGLKIEKILLTQPPHLNTNTEEFEQELKRWTDIEIQHQPSHQ